MSNRIQITKDFYKAFSEGDRNFVEDHLADGFYILRASRFAFRSRWLFRTLLAWLWIRARFMAFIYQESLR